jgi:hypothetical protein
MDKQNSRDGYYTDSGRAESKGKSRGSYKDVSTAAVRKEGDVKMSMGPSVSMTVVGEKVDFTQHFHF